MRLIFAMALLLSVLSVSTWAEETQPAVKLENVESEKIEKKEVAIILRMYMSSGWGVSGEDRKGIQILEDGKVQCTVATRNGGKVYAELKSLTSELVENLKKDTAALLKEKSQGNYNCADDVRQIYDNGKSGEDNIMFADLAMYEDCSSRRIEAPKSHYLEGFLNALSYQCPELPAEKE